MKKCRGTFALSGLGQRRGYKWAKRQLCLAVCGILSCLATTPGLAVEPLTRMHAHNDYEHPHPLTDALAAGFCSVEADIYVVDGQLLVAHELQQTRPGRTLQSLYLDPLREKIGTNNYVLAPNDGFTLLIDIKTNGVETYQVLKSVLARYSDLLTHFTDTSLTRGAVTVVLSGARPEELVQADPERLCAIDGKLADLELNPSRYLVPWISDKWSTVFTWKGKGKMPEAERQKLRELTRRAQAQGRRIRFWGAPDNPAVWRELFDANVDLINTDHLNGLRDFLLAQKNPHPPS
ncbi:MAG TPA: phosphatidylinositol-specific phospholipase C/glycerophosphodiester phosphodiesterase family protein [Verrucomicrobiae bacterium]